MDMKKSIIYLIAGLCISAYGLYIESNLVIFPGVMLQLAASLMRCTDGMEIVKGQIRDHQKTE